MATTVNFDAGRILDFLNYLQNQKSGTPNPYSDIINYEQPLNPGDIPYDIGTKYGKEYADPSLFKQLPYLPKDSAGRKANAAFLGERGLQDRRNAQFGSQAKDLATLQEGFKKRNFETIGGAVQQLLRAQGAGQSFDPNSVTPEQIGRLLEEQVNATGLSGLFGKLPNLNREIGSGQELGITQNRLLQKKAEDVLSRPEDITALNQAGVRKAVGESYTAPYVGANQFRVGPGGEEAYLSGQGFAEEQQFIPFQDPKTGQIINLPGQVTRRTTPGGVQNLKPKGKILSYDLNQQQQQGIPGNFGGYLSTESSIGTTNPTPRTQPKGTSAPANAAGKTTNLEVNSPSRFSEENIRQFLTPDIFDFLKRFSEIASEPGKAPRGERIQKPIDYETLQRLYGFPVR